MGRLFTLLFPVFHSLSPFSFSSFPLPLPAIHSLFTPIHSLAGQAMQPYLSSQILNTVVIT